MSYPEYILWPYDEQLWTHRSNGVYDTLDGIYVRPYDQLIDDRFSARALVDGGPISSNGETK